MHVAEFALRSSSLMYVANCETENRHVVIRSPLAAFNIKNYRTFTHAEIVDVNATAQLLRDDMPTITGSPLAEDGMAVIVCGNARVE